jgi:hypothetical protein
MVCCGIALIILGLIRIEHDLTEGITQIVIGILVIFITIVTYENLTDEEIEQMSEYP